MQPFVSIIVPVFNGENFLERTIKSLLNQSFKDFEVLFYDDCSSDNSIKIINKIISNDKRFTLEVGEKNIGLVPKIVKDRIKLLNGKFYMYMSQDDFLEFNAFELAYNDIIKNNSEISLFDFCFFLNENVQNKIIRGNKDDYIPIDGREAFKLSLDWSVAGAGFYSLDLIRKNGFEDFNMYADEFSVRKFFLNSKLVSFNKGLFYYNIDNPEAVTKKVKPALFSKLYKETKNIELYINNFENDSQFSYHLSRLIQMYFDYFHMYRSMNKNHKMETFSIISDSIIFFNTLNLSSRIWKLNIKIIIKFFLIKLASINFIKRALLK
jgi:glycosyltransferase involved in cell wall biosynthesis